MAPVGASALTVIPSPQYPAAPLPRVSTLSRAAVQAFIDSASPAVITTDSSAAGIGRRLTPDDLAAAFGSEPVIVGVSQNGAFRYDAKSKSGQRIPFDEFAEYVTNGDLSSGERRYLSQFPLDKMPRALDFELTAPPHIPTGAHMVAENLWFGPEGTISPLHVDRSHNLLVQHWGRKHVVVVAPQHYSQMLPGPKNSESPHVSSLNLMTERSHVDLSRLHAPCFETVVGPGDVLFLPAFWWHNVIALDAAISTNYWWRPPIQTCLHSSFFRMLSSRSVFDDPTIVHRWVDLTPHRLDTALCLFLVKSGHTFGAVALAAALVTAFCRRTLRVLGLDESPRPPRSSGSKPQFTQSMMVISALTAQGVIDSSQSALLLEWVTLAEETAAEPEPREYTAEQTAFRRNMVTRLHLECGHWLSP
jgi:hypothetical protein